MTSTEPTTQKPLKRISASEFARRLNLDRNAQDKRYAFFLGSGCSVTSGIKTAGDLVTDEWLPKLRDLMAPEETDLEAWGKSEFEYNSDSPAASYGAIMKLLFLQREEQQREIERLCDGKFPGFGYSVLAELMEHTNNQGTFNVVLTTNFDDLVSDALYLFTSVRPLVIHHESLVSYIRPTRTRPLIVKLHGDNHLSPYNTPEQTAALPDKTNQQVRSLLHDRGLIFLGYSGNDLSILKLLKTLPTEALPLGIYWCSQTEPDCQLSEWLREREAIWVESPRFDEFMLLVHAAMNLGHPDAKRFEDVFAKRMDRYKVLTGSIEQSSSNTAEQAALKEAIAKTDKSFPEWQAVVLEAYRLEVTNPEAAEAIYRDGVSRFPKSAQILSDYADFLKDRGQVEKAEVYFKRAVEAEPEDSDSLDAYGIFLAEEKRLQEAENYFKQAIKYDPSNANKLSNYALLLNQQNRLLEAEEYYKLAVGTGPESANALGNYAVFLSEQKRMPEAEEYYKRAIEADRKHTNSLRNYALFLTKQKRFKEAELYYKRAIKVDPTESRSLSRYANFLKELNRLQEAEEYYKRAIEASPEDVEVIGSFAVFLRQQNKLREAKEYFQRAVELDSTDANNLANFAQLLLAENGTEALDALDRAQEATSSGARPDLLLELSFYEFAHRLPLGGIVHLSKLKQLLLSGARSEGWDLSPNVARAQQDGHPFAEWLPKLAAVIADEAPVETLNDWPEWQQASE
jgi:tetratricopeptide (TPR) repeat protein